MAPEIEQLLEKEGWTVQCYSPLEIEHENGSFASLNAAEMVIQYLRDQEAEARAFIALTTIQGCAGIAMQSCDGLMKNLWVSVEGECSKALAR